MYWADPVSPRFDANVAAPPRPLPDKRPPRGSPRHPGPLFRKRDVPRTDRLCQQVRAARESTVEVDQYAPQYAAVWRRGGRVGQVDGRMGQVGGGDEGGRARGRFRGGEGEVTRRDDNAYYDGDLDADGDKLDTPTHPTYPTDDQPTGRTHLFIPRPPSFQRGLRTVPSGVRKTARGEDQGREVEEELVLC